MPPQKLNQLLANGKHYVRLKGQVIHSFEDKATVSLLKTGYVKRYLIGYDGTLGVQSIYGPGYFFPLTAAFIALFNRKIYAGEETYYYEAITDVEFYSMDTSLFAQAAQADPIIYKEILFEAGRRLGSNIQQIENLSLKDALRRVAHQLAYFASLYGETIDEGIKVLVPLTHQDIGDSLSLSRETVTRQMNKLKIKGLVDTDKHKHLIIFDIEKLKGIYT